MSAARNLTWAVADVVSAVRAACPDPLDQVRALLPLARAPGGGPVAVRARRAATVALCRAARDAQPGSYDEAVRLLDEVTAVLDVAIAAAGDAQADRTFMALRRLRVAVAADLLARGASLAPLIVVRSPSPAPALVMAHKLYGTATRADELLRRVDPVHPGFMPVSVVVLAR